ncbi:MAG: phospholipase D-like domain-containing protein [Ruminococcus sp.]|jgi:cardiolipin synthase|nr:phospholipase D-like domain-containing protein [Ruminococcus sp.]
MNSKIKFYKTGEEFLPDFLSELRKAEKFIYMEYYIISIGKFWNTILEILKEKVRRGVTVHIVYDALGSIRLPLGYVSYLEKSGIDVTVINLFQSHRDHRKITIIDGKTAFTGGINLADEYVGLKTRFGYWKDCAVKISSDAKGIFTFESNPHIMPSKAALFYHNIIKKAGKYIYIMTPYLSLDKISAQELFKKNIDIKIITPHIPDKPIVHMFSRLNYGILKEHNIQIYEYIPGFLHSKIILSDDKFAILGSINFDYFSFHSNFENGVYIQNSEIIDDIKEDFLNTIKKSKKIK